MDRAKLISDLIQVVGAGNVLHTPRDLFSYSYDAEEYQRPPDAVVFTLDAAETSAVVRVSRRHSVPVVARGAGTNLSGGTLTVNGGIVVECSRMTRVQSVDLENRRAVVEPGLVNLDLQNLLARSRYFYGPDPASQKVSTLGGNVGENAGGPHCYKYGVTSNHVLGMEVTLADGQTVVLGGPLEDYPGYDLPGVFVGSEGTLGIVSALTLRLLRSPESIRTMLVIFDSLGDAGEAVAAIVAAGMIPATLEVMDQKVTNAIQATRDFGFPLDAGGILLIEVDGLDVELDRQVEEIRRLCFEVRAREVRVAQSAAERDALWAGRRGAFGAIARLMPSYSVQDGTVPRTALAGMLLKVDEIARSHGVGVATLAHAGDGNLHPLLLFDHRDKDQVERIHRATKDILNACIEAGGTLSGEHGIGLSKQSSMSVQFTDAEIDKMARLKIAFDPTELMNPGKIFPVGLPETRAPRRVTPDPSLLQSRLGERLSEGTVKLAPDDLLSYASERTRPVAVARPTSLSEVVAAVEAAVEAGVPILPWGNGTRQSVGRIRDSEPMILDLGSMNGIVELDPGNQTLTVQAGATIADVNRAAAAHGLFFPIDVDEPERMTIGGLVATGASGPRRLGYGLPRDVVLGLRYVDPDGVAVKAGGKTMKDVAGYDVRKLLIGSWGTLGCIVEATLRLYPIPECNVTLLTSFSSGDSAARALKDLLASTLMPTAIELVNRPMFGSTEIDRHTSSDASVVAMIGLEGRREAVEKLRVDVPELMARHGAVGTAELSADQSAAVWIDRYAMLPSRRAGGQLEALISVPISRTAEVFDSAADAASRHDVSIGIVAHGGAGVARAVFESDDTSKSASAFDDLRRWVESVGGFAVLERGPANVMDRLGVWPRRGDHRLMERIRSAFDPNGCFSPGRVFASADDLAEVR